MVVWCFVGRMTDTFDLCVNKHDLKVTQLRRQAGNQRGSAALSTTLSRRHDALLHAAWCSVGQQIADSQTWQGRGPVAEGAKVVGSPAHRVWLNSSGLPLVKAHAHPRAPPQQLALHHVSCLIWTGLTSVDWRCRISARWYAGSTCGCDVR